MSLIAPASTGGCYCERLHSWFLFLFLSQLMLPVVLQSLPSRIFQWYSVLQCFNCVSNDYKMQLRLRNFGLNNSILINIPKLRFLYWQSTENGEKAGGGEGERKRGREGGRKEGRKLPRGTEQVLLIGIAAASKSSKEQPFMLPGDPNSKCPGCESRTKNSRWQPIGPVRIGKAFLLYSDLLAKEKRAVTGQLIIT